MISSSLHAHYAVIVQLPLCHHTSLLSCNSAQHVIHSCMRMRECLEVVWQLLPEIIIVPSCHSSFRLYWPPVFQPILKIPISVTALCL